MRVYFKNLSEAPSKEVLTQWNRLHSPPGSPRAISPRKISPKNPRSRRVTSPRFKRESLAVLTVVDLRNILRGNFSMKGTKQELIDRIIENGLHTSGHPISPMYSRSPRAAALRSHSERRDLYHLTRDELKEILRGKYSMKGTRAELINRILVNGLCSEEEMCIPTPRVVVPDPRARHV